MQIAAMRPRYLTRDEVPADVVAKEREIAEATAREEGKPEQALPKIIEGRLNGFFKDVVLLEQPSVQDNKKTVKARPRRGRRHHHPLRAHRDRRLTQHTHGKHASTATQEVADHRGTRPARQIGSGPPVRPSSASC